MTAAASTRPGMTTTIWLILLTGCFGACVLVMLADAAINHLRRRQAVINRAMAELRGADYAAEISAFRRDFATPGFDYDVDQALEQGHATPSLRRIK